MPGCHGDQSVLRRQLRGAGKREALILVIGINTTSINYGLVLLYYYILATSCRARALEERELLTVPMPGSTETSPCCGGSYGEPARGRR
ncbi:hypothetical protein NDU88_001247 [Pleurodeles waltl]|uniref:Uncharacterized protein n=1 Tax=Pleurodeles waltl TaxID=8319 RepID=A0AAV7UVH7_PLEWA|nr:hypothetical protein NDU88_001247 [Pleurodeles waltl]